MLSREELPTASIGAVFAEEITARRGEVTDTFDDGQRLFVRSVLPHIEMVRPDDRLQAGVALRAAGTEVWLHPYVFRQVCRNGAIVARSLQSRHLAELHLQEPEEALDSIREAVEVCCGEEAFTQTVQDMRNACEAQVDLVLALMPMLSRLPGQGNAHLVSLIMNTFYRDGDQSRFGLINAITATARDLGDPELRWNLEEFGGGVVIGEHPEPLPDQGRAAVARRTLAALVG